MSDQLKHEMEICSSIVEKFGLDGESIRATRARRVFGSVSKEIVVDVLAHAKNVLGFDHLCTITGQDEGENLTVYYHVSNPRGVVLNLKVSTAKSDPRVKTIFDVYNGSFFYERELVDLFGFIVEGLLPGERYPLNDDWPEGQYPLRKDWKPEMLEKNGG